jgi:hypothetical protein
VEERIGTSSKWIKKTVARPFPHKRETTPVCGPTEGSPRFANPHAVPAGA